MLARAPRDPARARHASLDSPVPPGGLAQLVVAPVSKTGGPRFESWIPRSPVPRSPAQEVPELARVVLLVGDLDEALRFYRDALVLIAAQLSG